MADHAKINLRDEAEDQAPKFSMPDGIEARFGRKVMGDSPQSGVSYFAYGPGFKTGFGHTHAEQEETYVIVAGGGTARVGDEDVELRTWDALRVPPGVPHALAAGPEGMEMIAFGASPPGDAEMIEDYW
ncbi:MAG: cupin domain-containing protein [Actinomycetota bacterium]|nr:cupin domain-containing protein [Actinomycetota bacterium]